MNNVAMFFDSTDGDRLYNGDDFRTWLCKFFTTGVFANELFVTDAGGMSVNIGAGYVNINGSIKFFDDDQVININPAGSKPRIDSVVIEWNAAEKDIILKTMQGVESDNPVAHIPVRNDYVYQLVVAQINVRPGTTELRQSNITDTRFDRFLCGYVINTVEESNLSRVIESYSNFVTNFIIDKFGEFDAWFEITKDLYSGDIETKLETIMSDLEEKVNAYLKSVSDLEDKVDSIDRKITAVENSGSGSVVKKISRISLEQLKKLKYHICSDYMIPVYAENGNYDDYTDYKSLNVSVSSGYLVPSWNASNPNEYGCADAICNFDAIYDSSYTSDDMLYFVGAWTKRKFSKYSDGYGEVYDSRISQGTDYGFCLRIGKQPTYSGDEINYTPSDRGTNSSFDLYV